MKTLLICCFLLTIPCFVSCKAVRVLPTLLNVYAKPDSGATIVTKLRQDDTVNVLAETNGWSYIEGRPGGYSRSQYLIEVSPFETGLPKKEYFVNTDNAEVRSGPGVNYSIVRKLSLNTPLKIATESGGWGMIAESSQWILMSYLSPNKVSATSALTPNSSDSPNKVPTEYTDPNQISDASKLPNLSDKSAPLPFYAAITQLQSPNRQNRSYNGKDFIPELIVCHITEASADSAITWLSNPTSRASCHFVISREGEITQLVDIKDAAWCQGTSRNPSSNSYYGKSSLRLVREKESNANLFSVGIEFEATSNDGGVITEAQIKAGADVIKFIRFRVYKEYGHIIPIDRDHIVGHSDVSPVSKPSCPGANFPFAAILEQAKKE